jgi:hypothetical protein
VREQLRARDRQLVTPFNRKIVLRSGLNFKNVPGRVEVAQCEHPPVRSSDAFRLSGMTHSTTSPSRRTSRLAATIFLFAWIALSSTAASAAVTTAEHEHPERFAEARTPNRPSDSERKPTASAPGGAEVRSELLSPIDLILVTDCSKSMIGKGGPRNIFSEVKAAAKDLVDWIPLGGSFVLVSYHAEVRLLPAVAIYGDRERNYARKAIDDLVANGNFTFTAQAVTEALKEAQRLHEAQLTRGETPRRKLVILLTDGIDDPPPHANGDARIVLADVARQFGEMPWYFWQIQLGPEIDREIDAALRPHIPNYSAVQVQELDALRKNVLPRIAATASRNWTVEVEPKSFDLGTIDGGSQHTAIVRFRADENTPTALVRVRPATASTGATVNVTPGQISLENGAGEVRLSIDVDASAAVGLAEGTVALESTDPSVRLASETVTWGATVRHSPSPVTIQPLEVDLGDVRVGEPAVAVLTMSARGPGSGHVRLRAIDPPAGIALTTVPEIVAVTSVGSDVELHLEVAPESLLNSRTVIRLAAEVVDGAISADETFAAVTLRPVPPWSWKPLAVAVAVAVVVLALVAVIARQVRRPRLHGRLHHWAPSGEAFSVDLARFGARCIRMAAQPGSEIAIAELGDSSATIAPTRRAGRVYCELHPAIGTSIKRSAGQGSGVELHDGDEFLIRDVRFRYRGDVPARFGQK